MQKIFITLFRTWFKILEIIFPFLAKKWAVNLFFTPLRYPVPSREKNFFKLTNVSNVIFSIDPNELYKVDYAKGRVLNKNFNSTEGKEFFKFYEVGDGPVILLVHGWSGRASQMGNLAQAFSANGYKVIIFDAFAHGESPGKQTTVLEFIKIIKKLANTYGPFSAMIGHSLGGIACGKAIQEGVATERLITIGSPTTFQYLLDAYGRIINANKKTTDYIKEFTENYARAPVEKYSLATIGKELDIPGLIIHDYYDMEATYDNALVFNDTWPKGQLISTKGLGHSRILRDRKTIELMINFVSVKEPIEVN